MTPSQLHRMLLDSLIDLAWGQWTALGVAGVGRVPCAIVDPEALLVATMSIGRWDARLFDESLDWAAVNNAIVDAARLRRLARDSSPEQRRLVAVLARLASQGETRGGLKRVETDLIARESRADYSVQPLFRSTSSAPQDWAGADEAFASAGFQRPAPELRGMSRRPDTSHPACLRFKARALVGIGPRAEVLSYLWTHDWAHGRLIAERGAYTQSTVAEYLAALCTARLAEKRIDGRRTEYRLVEALRSIGRPEPRYVAWDRVWPALTRLLDSLDSPSLSQDALWSKLASALVGETKALAAEGFAVHVPDLTGWAVQGPHVLEKIINTVERRVRALSE
jgi:hypothetical protein